MPGARELAAGRERTGHVRPGPRRRGRLGRPTIQGVVVLADAEDGRPLAVMDSTEITLRRTGWRRDGELHLALEAGLMSRSDVHAELAEVVAGRKPGRRPVVITATFVGFVVGGLSGAVAATAGIFLPAVLFTLAAAPLLRRHGQRPRLRGFVRGVTVAVVGVLAGTTPLVARSVLVDAPTRALAAASLAALLVPRRIPEPVLVLAGALAGFVLRAGA